MEIASIWLVRFRLKESKSHANKILISPMLFNSQWVVGSTPLYILVKTTKRLVDYVASACSPA